MSTGACIALKVENSNTIISSIVSCDGYLEHLGKLLLNHYNTYEKVQALIYLGNAEGIHESLENSKFDYRDFGSSWEDAKNKEFNSEDEFDEYLACNDHWFEYEYQFQDGKWFLLVPYKQELAIAITEYEKNQEENKEKYKLEKEKLLKEITERNSKILNELSKKLENKNKSFFNRLLSYFD